MRKMSLARQYEAVAEAYLNLYPCGGCGRLRHKGYVCVWAPDGCPGDENDGVKGDER